MLRFLDIADFEISADGCDVTLSPVPGADNGTIQHLYLNHVVPHALSQQSALVFHASAVSLRQGAVAFIGEAGMGKSTLAAALARQGYPFLCDDGLMVTASGPSYLAHPSHPSIRLWEDSQAELGLDGAEAAEPVSFSAKVRLLAHDVLGHHDRPAALLACFCLKEDDAGKTEIQPMKGSIAFQYLFAQSFLLDINDASRVKTHFSNVTEFAARVPCFTLDYPRRYDLLDATGADIRSFVHSLGHP